ncbi:MULTISPECIES: glycerol dehydrogenase [unclassified Cryobacterium]|uniref:glycerol dehydrogenase n=1 Tax=unclassified Cryobacterium TaxID=2649013 RepID=UPI002AB59CBD|nr:MULTISPECIES: glycerol dehydrogenase [unclassified Cryobacterium]MDY7541248.1 glycerol dehydrogenase [Cryobacterium sp. 5B3]MEB0001012.1 glycerol dehydrogenase [Cryobacterium sp. RTS3]MEB0267894.1 glycerol dehydrogenase [Cryobacterium sp. 10I5]MEB0276649.1 glycerol dehydrogenase [Cryobacterium sp. 5B3]
MAASSAIRTIISPGRYVQGKGALSRLGEFLAPLGKTPLLVSDDVVWGILGQRATDSLRAAQLPVTRERFGGIPTAAEVTRLVGVIDRTGADVIVALGGGSTLDAVKAAGFLAGIRWVTVPSVASTDAPTSALSVIYTADGAFEEYRFFPKNPDLVLMDTQLVADAPAAFLAAGVGDALATWLEARATRQSHANTMAGGLPTLAGTALAELSWGVIWDNALPALDAVRDHQVTPAVEKLVEANTLLSGLGFESGGLAAAHAIHNGLTAAHQTHGLAHGQKVNIGSVTQLVLEGAPTQEIRDFIEFTTRVGLPNTLTEVGLSVEDEDDLRRVAEAATVPGETIHNMPFPITPDELVSALKSIERFSRTVRSEAHLPAPVQYVARQVDTH